MCREKTNILKILFNFFTFESGSEKNIESESVQSH